MSTFKSLVSSISSKPSTKYESLATEDGEEFKKEEDSKKLSQDLTTTILDIQGMTCSACTGSVTKKLSSLEQVESVNVSLLTNQAIIKYHPNDQLTGDSLAEMVEDIGFDAKVNSTISPKLQIKNDNDSEFIMTKISIQGMTCSACVNSVTSAIKQLPGIEKIDISLLTEEGIVEHSKVTSSAEIVEIVDDCGFEAKEIESFNKNINDIDTGNELKDLNVSEKINLQYFGQVINESEIINDLRNKFVIDEVFINPSKSIITISYNPQITGIRTLYNYIHDIYGLDLLIFNGSSDMTESQLKLLSKFKEIEFWKNSFIKSIICGLPAFFLSGHLIPQDWMNQHDIKIISGVFAKDILCLILASYLQFSVGSHFYISAYKSLRHGGSATMDVLVVISTTLSYFFSLYSILMNVFISANSDLHPVLLFDTTVMLFIFISLGKWMESKAKGQTTSSLSELMKLIPYSCDIVDEPMEFDKIQDKESLFTSSISVDLIQLNDIILIKPGGKIPIDGVLIYGQTDVNESLLTGESLPVAKKVGDELIGGSVNLSNVIFMKVNSLKTQTKLNQIIGLVKDAQFRNAPIQQFSDYIASKFVPIIVGLAILTFFCWYCGVSSGIITEDSFIYPKSFMMHKSNGIFFNCLKISISVIVIACPCALGLAAPTAIMAGTGTGAKNGILVRGGDVFERLHKVDTILFDKTNTLTMGKMSIISENIDYENLNEKFQIDQKEFWNMIKNCELNNGHPISVAIVSHVKDEVTNNHWEDLKIENVVGKGIIGKFDSNLTIKIGNKSFLPSSLIENFKESESSLGTTVYFVFNDEYIGNIILSDRLKNDAKAVISALQLRKIETLIVTGDGYMISKDIAEQLNIPLTNVYAEVSPERKQQIVESLKENNTVLFIGDGINDAAAISAADVGVSFNDSTDIAASAANVILLESESNNNQGNLQKLVLAIDLSKKTFGTIKWNFFLASVYNLCMIPMAMAGIINPFLAAGAMSISSVCVVTNSLRLNQWKPEKVM